MRLFCFENPHQSGEWQIKKLFDPTIYQVDGIGTGTSWSQFRSSVINGLGAEHIDACHVCGCAAPEPKPCEVFQFNIEAWGLYGGAVKPDISYGSEIPSCFEDEMERIMAVCREDRNIYITWAWALERDRLTPEQWRKILDNGDYKTALKEAGITSEDYYMAISKGQPTPTDDRVRDYSWKLADDDVPSSFFDDCVASAFLDGNACEAIRRKESNWGNNPIADWPCSTLIPSDTYTTIDGWNAEGVVYFDKECKPIVDASQEVLEEECRALLEYGVSPVSLIWDASTDIEAETAIVRFPLQPAQPTSWFIWKASDKAPLLVYDPEHSGKIESAYQLFGNWTFGGKSTASLSDLAVISDSAVLPQPWQDGYEALASLDGDQNDRIDGEELVSLALWFDRNRNGISEDGEVVPLHKAGIVELYYQPDRTDSDTKSIHADIGYRRIVDGKEVLGPSVDWYAKGAETKSELLDDFVTTLSCQDGDKTAPKLEVKANEKLLASPQGVSPKLSAREAMLRTVNGVWRWSAEPVQAEKNLGYAPHGYFIIDDDNWENPGDISGLSMVYHALKKEFGGARSRLGRYWIEGDKTVSPAGKVDISFRITTKNKLTIQSKATLSADGKELLGESTASGISGAEKRSITYQWKARRTNGKK